MITKKSFCAIIHLKKKLKGVKSNMLKDIEVLCHSSIRIDKEKIIYIDPFKIEKNYNNPRPLRPLFRGRYR